MIRYLSFVKLVYKCSPVNNSRRNRTGLISPKRECSVTGDGRRFGFVPVFWYGGNQRGPFVEWFRSEKDSLR